MDRWSGLARRMRLLQSHPMLSDTFPNISTYTTSPLLAQLNEEQLRCIALFVDRLEQAFLERPDPSQPWLHPARVLMTMIMDGGGGCGKTTLSTEVVLPLLETFFHPEGVLRRAPSNKPTRLIGGRTMHSGQGLTTQTPCGHTHWL